MGEECELDEDVLDYCEENDVKELLGIIYEEDDDYDYLTYDISKRTSLDDFIKGYLNCEQVLSIIRNVANNLISLKEQAIHLAYVLLNRNFMYIDKDTLDIKFICLPIESESSIITEFKGFLRQLLANMKYNVDEDLNYVGKLITYINGDKFTLRDLIGLCQALMEEAGVEYNDVSAIDAEGGVEVVESSAEETVTGFMDSLGGSDEPLPEIGDDEDDEEEENDEAGEAVAPIDLSKDSDDSDDKKEEAVTSETAEAKEKTEEVTNESASEASEEIKEAKEINPEDKPAKKTSFSIAEDTDAILGINEYEGMATSGILLGGTSSKKSKETDIDVIKKRMQELVGEVPDAKESIAFEGGGVKNLDEVNSYMGGKKAVKKKNVVKVNRAAIIQNVEAGIEKEDTEGAENVSEDNPTENIVVPVVEDVKPEEVPNNTPTSSPSVLSRTVPENAVMNSVANVPKAAPYLVRVNTEERVMITKVPFKIGKASRGVDYTIRGNGAVSRQHAIIIEKDDVCYIRDNKSTNHTYVNGKMVEDGEDTMLTHDSLITLGDEDFVFKIR